ncbi:ABC transporter ATP-binding protein [Streptomyces sp. GS7]|uniref:ABC transporter ATP-binding protein n=1 Tax=Streptomyces sp. GS7 TaxID=2692234 RepID=UPI001315D676|nr:ATP-binding cassette domain-containing protein [Streptomyces sp. GS7]QHC24910.1 ATP-binding cassette domain-containing protein [Streptomyces sp. GS7]
MIDIQDLTKHYGDRTAVDALTFRVEPGAVTGFLGPNGAGKSTTMRMVLGLDRPTAGRATVLGRPYTEIRYPLNEVGALLDARAMHSGRSARGHLHVLAQSNRIPTRRVDEVLAQVGLYEVAGRRVKGFSLGMRQRLGIAAALLGDPAVLLLDEPVNGLDPEGIRWVRDLMRSLAAEGRTVLVSSHHMSEMALTADHLVVIGRGRLLADTTVKEFVAGHARRVVHVRTPHRDRLTTLLDGAGINHVLSPGDDEHSLQAYDTEPAAVGDLAASAGLALHELRPEHASLEEAYLGVVAGDTEYRTALTGVPAVPPHQGA